MKVNFTIKEWTFIITIFILFMAFVILIVNETFTKGEVNFMPLILVLLSLVSLICYKYVKHKGNGSIK